MASITKFKTQLKGGVRPNLYEVIITFPTAALITSKSGGDLAATSSYLCRSAALPGHNQGVIEVPFRGRFLKIPGDRTFESWTATFYNTQDFDLRSAFEQWVNLGNKVDENLGSLNFAGDNPGASLFQDIIVKQKSKDIQTANSGGDDPNKTLRAYKLFGCWPSNVGAINLAFDSNDQIEEFDVEFQYQYFDAGFDENSLGELTTRNTGLG
jgi:hypothetical protein